MRYRKIVLSTLCSVAWLSAAALAEGNAAPPAAPTTPPVAPAAPVVTPQPDLATPMPPSDKPASADEGKKVVCKILKPETGTRLGGRKVCMTQKQWDDMADVSKRSVVELRNSGSGAAPGN